MPHLKDERTQLVAVIALALVARLMFIAFLAAPVDLDGGDAWWYLAYGAALARVDEPAPVPAGPGYLLFAGIIANLFPEPVVIPLIQLAQAALGALTVGLAYGIGRRLWSPRAGLIAGTALAISPAFVVETANVATETLFIFLLLGALALYTQRAGAGRSRALAVVGIILGLATLTRAVLLAFPAALALHLAMTRGWRRAVRPAAAMLLAFALTLAPWTAYNLARWNRFVVAADGFVSFLWLGTQEEGWQGPEASDAALGVTADDPENRDYTGKAAEAIRADPAGYAALRLRNLAEAFAQPHNTAYFHGESLKEAAARWLAEDRSLSGLAVLARIEAFWPKLALYVFHYTGVIMGLAGMVIQMRRPGGGRAAGALYALVAYFLAVHLVLYVIPRYLFPLEAIWWLFAAFTCSQAWDALAARRARRTLIPS